MLIIVKNIKNKQKINQKKENHQKEIINRWEYNWTNKMIKKISIINNQIIIIIWIIIWINNQIIQINNQKVIITIITIIITIIINLQYYKKTFHQWFHNKY